MLQKADLSPMESAAHALLPSPQALGSIITEQKKKQRYVEREMETIRLEVYWSKQPGCHGLG